MNIKKFFIFSSIILAILALFVVILFFINAYIAKDFLNSVIIKYTLIFLAIGWGIILIIYLIIIGRKSKPITFRKEEIIQPKKAKELWALNKSIREGIPIINNKYKKDAFNFYKAWEPFPSGREWFCKAQCEVKEGNNPGIYTLILPLSRGEDWILGEGFREVECIYDDLRVRSMPLQIPEDPRERIIEQIAEISPERAVELQQQMLERRLTQPTPAPQVTPEEMPRMVMPPPYRRYPYRRYYPHRRYY